MLLYRCTRSFIVIHCHLLEKEIDLNRVYPFYMALDQKISITPRSNIRERLLHQCKDVSLVEALEPRQRQINKVA